MRTIKMVKRIGSSEIKGADCTLARNEDNDCVVRALAAMADVPYEQAHEYAAGVLARKPRRGVSLGILISQIRDRGGLMGKDLVEVKAETKYKNAGKPVTRQMTTQTFFKRAPENRTFLVVVRGHIFCFKNGEVVGGTHNDAIPSRHRIKRCWTIPTEGEKKDWYKVASLKSSSYL